MMLQDCVADLTQINNIVAGQVDGGIGAAYSQIDSSKKLTSSTLQTYIMPALVSCFLWFWRFL